ncbi:MAG: hypothetical protein KF873_07835 [Gemmataceae bacterium]|nr:hypothetical protein [Planctomycetia bacterium]MBX3398633.1 hypothetical protein [Gemmataceae bacterium]
MPEPVVALPTYEDLCRYIRQTLCEQDALDYDQTPFFQTPIHRRGRAWGVLFHVVGPRELKTSAVWAEPEGRVVFYNSMGQRTREVQLQEAPANGVISRAA